MAEALKGIRINEFKNCFEWKKVSILYCIKRRVFWRLLKFKYVRLNTQIFINPVSFGCALVSLVFPWWNFCFPCKFGAGIVYIFQISFNDASIMWRQWRPLGWLRVDSDCEFRLVRERTLYPRLLHSERLHVLQMGVLSAGRLSH